MYQRQVPTRRRGRYTKELETQGKIFAYHKKVSSMNNLFGAGPQANIYNEHYNLPNLYIFFAKMPNI